MAIVNWKKLTIPSANPASDHVFVGVDASGRLYLKDYLGNVTLYPTLAEQTLAINTAINNLIDGAPATLDTLNELAAALADDANFASTITGLLSAHTSNFSNPHNTTKEQVGLGNCDNTSDLDKPVSGPQHAALDLKLNISDLKFGTFATYAESLALSSVATTTPTQKLRLTTPNIPAGNYRIAWSYKWFMTDGANSFVGRLQLDDTTNLMNHFQEPQDVSTNQKHPEAGFAHVDLTAGVHTFDIDFNRSGGGGTVGIEQVRMEFWRMS